MNLRKAGCKGERARNLETQYPDVTVSSSEGRWAEKDFILTRGRPAGYVPETRNYDDDLLSVAKMLSLRSQGVADLVIVIVKPQADENMVTCLRIKPGENDRKLEMKDQT